MKRVEVGKIFKFIIIYLFEENEDEECNILYQLNDFDRKPGINKLEKKFHKLSNLKTKQEVYTNDEPENSKNIKINFNLSECNTKINHISYDINLYTKKENEPANKTSINFENNFNLNTITHPNIHYNNKQITLNRERKAYPIFGKNYKSMPKINFVIKNSLNENKKENVESDSNKTLEDNSIIYPFQFCYICDSLNQMDFVSTSTECDHTICFKCLKTYFEAKIDQHDFAFKCPIYFCKSKYTEQLIKVFISEQHFKFYSKRSADVINTHIENIHDNNRMNNNLNEKKSSNEAYSTSDNRNSNSNKQENKNCSSNNFNSNLNSLNIKMIRNSKVQEYHNNYEYLTTNLKAYTQKNVVEYNKIQSFLDYNKNKEIYCKKCNQPALFYRRGKSIVKCLNCFNSSCKYCLKPMTFDHFDLNTFNYCKVYYRRKLKVLSLKSSSLNKLKNFIISFLMIIASYLLIFLNCYYLLSRFLKKILCLQNDKKTLYYHFINKYNYKKFLFLRCLLEDRLKTLHEENIILKEFNINTNHENKNPYKNKKLPDEMNSINLEKNNIILVGKPEILQVNDLIEKDIFDSDKIKEYKWTLHLRSDNDNKNSEKGINLENLEFFNYIKHDNNLLIFFKNNIHKPTCYKQFCLKKLNSFPDPNPLYFFKEKEFIVGRRCFKLKKENSKEEINDDILKYETNQIIIKENFLRKFIKEMIFYIIFIPVSLFIFVCLLIFIPYFPMIILIFQV